MSESDETTDAVNAEIPEEADEEAQTRAFNELLRDAAAHALQDAPSVLARIRQDHEEFMKRNEIRWRKGFDALETLIAVCLEAGEAFQKEFLLHAELQTDILLGVLMRIHARSCRVAGEIAALLKNGYADGALSRWRTLHELAVSAVAIRKLGRSGALDYYLCGKVKALEGMRKYQQCAVRMGYVPYTDAEISDTQHRVDTLLKIHGRKPESYPGSFGWVWPHIGSSKFDKLQEFAELGHWWHDYAWASQDVHAGYREVRALLAVSDTSDDLLLAGPSNAGMTDPAHRTAISLSQATSAFLCALLPDDKSLVNQTATPIWLTLIDQLTQSVGRAFLNAEKEENATPA